MCKVGIHLCNHGIISTLAIFPGKRVNSGSQSVTTERRPALPSLISMGLPLLFVTTLSSSFYLSQLSDAEVVESLVQLASLSKAASGPRVRWRKLIVSEQMSHCWADQPH